MKKTIIAILLFISSILVCAQSTKISHSSQALRLNKKAVKLLVTGWDGNSNTTNEQLNSKILKILDSAIQIEPNYYSALSNKLYPLIQLHRYSDALTVIKKTIKINPDDFSNYIKGAIIYKDFLHDRSNSERYFKEAYHLAKLQVKKNSNSSVLYHTNIAFVLVYFKGKKSALKYLSEISPKYTDPKSIQQLEYFKQKLLAGKFTKEENLQLFKNYTTI